MEIIVIIEIVIDTIIVVRIVAITEIIEIHRPIDGVVFGVIAAVSTTIWTRTFHSRRDTRVKDSTRIWMVI